MMRKVWRVGGAITLAMLVAAESATAMDSCPTRRVTTTPGDGFHYLNQVGATQADQSRYYHLSGGTQFIPYEWFLALPDGQGQGLFLDDEHLRRIRLMPDLQPSPHNPDRLPIGFTKTTYDQDPKLFREYIGVTCAFCHTSHFTYMTPDKREHHLYVEGASSFQDNFAFMKSLLEAVVRAANDDAAFDCFAGRVLKSTADEPRRLRLRKQLEAVGSRLLSRASPEVATWGIGRIDALGRAGNSLYSNLDHDNYRYVNAPVSIPPLWNIQHYDWVQWSGSIQNPLARNIAQIIGIGAGLFEDKGFLDNPATRFASSLDVKGLTELETLTETIRPPHWPEAIFGAIDLPRATAGKALYKARCKHCHVPKPLETPTVFGQRFELTLVDQEEVGTDPAYLKNFASRTIGTGPLAGYFGTSRIAMGTATQRVTTTLMEMAGRYEPNEWLAHTRYLARPQAGIWATPPFLHNGAVPNLYQLLSPKEERDTCFLLGDLAFDPVDIGYIRHPCTETQRLTLHPPDFRFDTNLNGNSNQGHEFRNDVPVVKNGIPAPVPPHTLTKDDCTLLETKGKDGWLELKHRGYAMTGVIGCALSPEERRQIIEYLKTCDLDDVAWNDTPSPKVCRSTVARTRD